MVVNTTTFFIHKGVWHHDGFISRPLKNATHTSSGNPVKMTTLKLLKCFQFCVPCIYIRRSANCSWTLLLRLRLYYLNNWVFIQISLFTSPKNQENESRIDCAKSGIKKPLSYKIKRLLRIRHSHSCHSKPEYFSRGRYVSVFCIQW